MKMIDIKIVPNKKHTAYHYCSLDSFMKIISSKKIRLTDIIKSNDSMEIKYCQSKMSELIFRIERRLEFHQVKNKHIYEFFKNFNGDTYASELFQNMQISWFAFCFSKHENLLSQWRGYADDGRGIAIGFNEYFLQNNQNRLVYSDITYDTKELLNKLEIDFIKSLLEAEEKQYKMEEMFNVCENLIYEMSIYFLSNSVFYKHPAFSEEGESRLVYFTYTNIRTLMPRKSFTFSLTNNPYFDLMMEHNANEVIGDFTRSEIRFLNRNNRVVPHFDLDFSSKVQNYFISEIILGPKNNSDLRDIQTFMLTNGFDVTTIKFSKSITPFV